MGNRGITITLFGLTALFYLRCLGQLLVYNESFSFLPGFYNWQLVDIPYSFSLTLQFIILCAMIGVTCKVAQNYVQPSLNKARFCMSVGWAYLGFMVFRMGIGVLIADTDSWFAVSISDFFHLVLAAFIILTGHIYKIHPLSRA